MTDFPLPLDTAPMDGFRCLAFKAGGVVDLRAQPGKPLGRYFPEIVAALADHFVPDGARWARPMERKAFFSEEKKQKIFFGAVTVLSGSLGQGNKSFLVLFYKKELLLFLKL